MGVASVNTQPVAGILEVPTGKTIEIPVTIEDKTIIVSCRDFELNHSCHCWRLSRESLATIVAYRILDLQLPKELASLCIVRYPDLDREHVPFIVDGQNYDFSLYGLRPVKLQPEP
jgi:hypothetical protein